jgi:hypothetical protein
MKLLMLLIEYWNADKWKCAPTPLRWVQNGPSKNKSDCPRFYAKTKWVAKVKNKGAGGPYPRTPVYEGVLKASECVTATGYDPKDDNPTEHTLYTVVCNVNASLFDKGASCIRQFFKPDTGSYLVGMDNHASCCMYPHLDMFVSL